MMHLIYQWVDNKKAQYIPIPGRVLEIGSLDINGSIRPIFSNATEYIGIDQQDGKGVDLVLHSSDCLSKFGKESFDTIISCEALEHDKFFWHTIEDMKSMLKSNGFLIITTPTFEFPYHMDKDYYRFSKDVYNELFFKDMNIIEISQIYATVLGIAKKK